jgi:methylenetetrahydrofolate--tRNA-(uracil-5-)-methyltransferase
MRPLSPAEPAPSESEGDYLNCPFTEDEYRRFHEAVVTAEKAEVHDFDNTKFFEGCLPVEVMAHRGVDTLRFGPMKPAGLRDPRTGRRPYAVVQLRQENLRADSYNLVGFQNHLKFGEQARILRLIPGLENAQFLRYGQIHRNTYINAPPLLDNTLKLRNEPNSPIFFAGQISGVEGYLEAIATGFTAGRNAAALAIGEQPRQFPRETAIGSLAAYISGADPRNYQPANITFDLLPKLDDAARQRLRHDKKARHAEICRRAAEALEEFLTVEVA